MKKYCLLFLGICLAALSGYGQTVHDLYVHYQAVSKKYLVKSPTLNDFFSINQQGIALYASPADKKEGKAECMVFWEEVRAYQQLIASGDRALQWQY
jgi:hypothetical protein